MELTALFKSTAALAFVLALVGLTSFLLRRYGAERMLRGQMQKAISEPKTTMGKQQKRLAISEFMALDSRRRLVLIRRDDVEHLVLIAPDHELVIESDIRKQDKTSQEKKRY